jgi:hydroxypyruvate reductase
MTRRELERALERSLAALDLRSRVAAALPRCPRRVRLIAIGKAAPAMTAGALAAWGATIANAVVVTTDGTDTSGVESERRVELLRAAHPVPDARSVRAAERCLEVAGQRGGDLLVLISGGASALVCAPARGVRLADKQRLTREMLRAGASIQDLNVARKHLSRIKGGALARAASPDRVLTLVASDVIGGTASDVGSGPSTSDTSTLAAARRILRRHTPRFATLPLVRTGEAPNARARIVASPEELARAMAVELRARGLRVRVLAPSQAPVEELAREYVALARKLAPGSAIVRAAEPSVIVRAGVGRGGGRGGRSTHLAALVGASLPDGAMFLAAATDGVDGTSGTGGAIVDARFARVASLLSRALERYDTGPLHLALGSALPARPTGHNLADVHVLLVRGR